VSALKRLLGDYLTVRRAMGFKLGSDERVLTAFVHRLDRHGQGFITVQQAAAFIVDTAGSHRAYLANRATMVRGFATFAHAVDARHAEIPAGLFPHGPHRATPYLYTDHEVTALVQAAAAMPHRVTALTMSTLLAVLATTGVRLGEALRLDLADLDLADGVLAIARSKWGRSRTITLHPTTSTALAAYLTTRQQLLAHPLSPALFLSAVGTRKREGTIRPAFHKLRAEIGLNPRSANCRPRIHDLRHTFAVRTLIDWYRDGGDVAARLPLLSAYLGHRDPQYTYWYLHAAPELLAEAAKRLEPPTEGRSG
jgi:integrase